MKSFLNQITLTLVSAATVVAEEAHEHGGHEAHPSLMWPWINFIIFIVVLGYILKRPFSEMWDSRRSFLINLREKGLLELKSAQTRFRDAEVKIQTVEADAKKIATSIIEDGEREGMQLVNEARTRAERTLKQVEVNIAAERRSAEITLRRSLADMVLRKAGDKIRKELTPDADRAIRERVVGNVRQLMQ